MGFLIGIQPIALVLSGLLIGVSYWTFRNFHISISLGMASLPLLWRFVFGKSWLETGIMVFLLLTLGLKRILDAPYMRKIRTASGW